VRDYRYLLLEHEPDRPGMVVGVMHRTVTLADDVNFHDWAQREWPAPRWTVTLEASELPHRSSDR
jgi:hypothetical protein